MFTEEDLPNLKKLKDLSFEEFKDALIADGTRQHQSNCEALWQGLECFKLVVGTLKMEGMDIKQHKRRLRSLKSRVKGECGNLGREK